MKTHVGIMLLAATVAPAPLAAQSAADSAAIVSTSLDYIEGWYEGDAARMGRALHAELAKRIVWPAANGPDRFSHMTAAQLVTATGMGGGTQTAVEERGIVVRILDIYENASVVRVDARDWVDYLQIARIDGEWKIINVLWAIRPDSS